MGGICSRRSTVDNLFQEANGHFNDRSKTDRGGYKSNVGTVIKPPPVAGIKEKKLQEDVGLKKVDATAEAPYGQAAPAAPDDVFYDGIPRYPQKSRSVRSTQAAVAKVSASAVLSLFFVLV